MGASAAALWAELARQLPGVASLRQALHADPHISGLEGPTRDALLAALAGNGAPALVAETGAVVRIGRPGPAIGIRGEMDALPVTEQTRVPWASARDGVMHACGHDAHMAALVAVARTIAAAGGPYPLLAVLQPREETYPSGAHDIVETGVLQDEQCQAMIGAHVQPTLAAGTVACVPGGVNAAADEFEITVHGSPGHAAYPHLTTDPIITLATIVVAAQAIVARSVDPMKAAVVGFSTLTAGDAPNVVPGTAKARGTLRSLSRATREVLHKRLREVATGIAAAHGCTVEVNTVLGEPVLHNDPALVAATAPLLESRGLTVSADLRSLGADDFSYYADLHPSLMMFVGTETSDQLHSATFLPSETDVAHVAQAMLAGYLGAAQMLEASGAEA